MIQSSPAKLGGGETAEMRFEDVKMTETAPAPQV